MAKKKSTSKIGAKKGDTGIPVSDTEAKEVVTETKRPFASPMTIITSPEGAKVVKETLGDMIVEPDGYEFVEDVVPVAEILSPPLDTIHEPAQAAAQIEADKLFEKGITEAETAFQPFIEPSANDIQAEVLGRIETARHKHTEALAAFVEDNPGIELDRSADHAKIAARTR